MILRRFLPVFGAFLAIAGLLLAPFASAHVDHEWTTTAEFTAGTKSSSNGNYQVEDRTDNPRIAANRLELGNIGGDNFNVADADANTFKWTSAGDATCTQNTPTTTIRQITAGALDLGAGKAVGVATVNLKSNGRSFASPFEVSFKSTRVAADSGAYAALLIQNENFCAGGGSGSVDGFYYLRLQSAPATDFQYKAYSELNGVSTQQGATTTITGDPYYLRITYDGTTARWWYSSDGVTWILDESYTVAFVGPWYTSFSVADAAGGVTTEFLFDDYSTTGAISLGGYQTSGVWTSFGVNITDALVFQLVLSHEDLTSDYYINEVTLLAGGNTVQDWSTTITSGTLTVLNVTATIPVTYYGGAHFYWNASVAIGLKGVGEGTPVITAIGLVYTVPPAAPPALPSVTPMLIEILLFAAWLSFTIIALYVKSGILLVLAGIAGILLATSLVATSSIATVLFASFGVTELFLALREIVIGKAVPQ